MFLDPLAQTVEHLVDAVKLLLLVRCCVRRVVQPLVLGAAGLPAHPAAGCCAAGTSRARPEAAWALPPPSRPKHLHLPPLGSARGPRSAPPPAAGAAAAGRAEQRHLCRSPAVAWTACPSAASNSLQTRTAPKTKGANDSQRTQSKMSHNLEQIKKPGGHRRIGPPFPDPKLSQIHLNS